MNKKQRNRKIVKQNKRNRITNRRYSSMIKTLSKLFKLKLKNFLINNEENVKSELKIESKKITNNLYSILDKAVKKNVIHKNNAARKKSRIAKLILQFL